MSVTCRERCWPATPAWRSTHLRRTTRNALLSWYCSVGYRSSRLAEELRARGFENVFNLEGSLFQWANEGRPLYRGEERVDQAHPYDEEWGQLLDRRLWAD